MHRRPEAAVGSGQAPGSDPRWLSVWVSLAARLIFSFNRKDSRHASITSGGSRLSRELERASCLPVFFPGGKHSQWPATGLRLVTGAGGGRPDHGQIPPDMLQSRDLGRSWGRSRDGHGGEERRARVRRPLGVQKAARPSTGLRAPAPAAGLA